MQLDTTNETQITRARRAGSLSSPIAHSRARILVTIGCLCGSPACGGKPTGDTLNVGLLLPFTGGDAAMGNNLEEAAMMVADNVNANGGLTGRPLRLIVGDTHSDGPRALESLTRILNQGVVAVVGPASTVAALAILPVLKEQRIVLVSPYGTDSIDNSIADADYPWFRLEPTPIAFGQALAKRMIADGATAATILYTSDEYNSSFADATADMLRQLGGTVSAAIPLPVGYSDYSASLVQISPSILRVVVLAADPISGARIANDLSVVNPTQTRQWYFPPSLKTGEFVSNSLPEKIEGGIGVAPDIFAATDRFNGDFATAWNGDVPSDGAYYYYDALMLMALAVEQAWVATGAQTPAFEVLRDDLRAVAQTRGVVTQWDQTAMALGFVRAGMTTYYSGLSGPILLENTGERKLGMAAFWKVLDGKIVTAN